MSNIENHRISVAGLFQLNGKTAIVTGATGGIGLILTLALAEAGVDIVSVQLPNDQGGDVLRKGVEQRGRRFQAFESNLKDYASIPQTFVEVWKAGVQPDILLNCAGVTRICAVEDTTIQNLDDVIDLNFKAAFVVSQEFGKKLLKEGRPGKIIHIASMAAQLVQTDISVYAPSKAAIRALTRAQSNEWAQKGIQVNCISPGWIHTGMTGPLSADKVFFQKVVDRTASRRWGQAEDLIGVTIFLASRASDFVTGEEIVVDGGAIGL